MANINPIGKIYQVTLYSSGIETSRGYGFRSNHPDIPDNLFLNNETELASLIGKYSSIGRIVNTRSEEIEHFGQAKRRGGMVRLEKPIGVETLEVIAIELSKVKKTR